MNSKLPKSFYIIPLIYAVLIAGFIHLHLQEIGGRTIDKSLGPISVSYRHQSGVGGGVSRLNLEIAGLQADLSEGVPVRDAGGRSDRIPVKNVTATDERIRIVLERGGSIECSIGFSLEGGVKDLGADLSMGDASENPGVAIIYRPDKENPEDFLPELRLTLPAASELQPVLPRLPLLQLRTGAQDLLIASNNSVSQEGQQMLVSFDQAGATGAFQQVRRRFASQDDGIAGDSIIPGFVAQLAGGEDDLLGYWFFGKNDPPSRAEADSRLSDTLEAMARSWRGGGSDPRLAAALAAYTLKEESRIPLDQYPALFQSANENAEWIAAPYVGNVVTAEQNYLERENEWLDDFGQSLRETPAQALADVIKDSFYPDMASALIFSGNDEILQGVEEAGTSMLQRRLDNSNAAAALFEISVQALTQFPDQLSGLTRFAEDAYHQVLSNIVQADGSLVYRSFAGSRQPGLPLLTVDPLVQLRMATSLREYGEAVGSDTAGRVGDALLWSVLDFADGNGAFPAEISVSGGEMQYSDSRIAGEAFYPFFPNKSYYPRVVSLETELNRNIRIWTSARGVGAVQREDGFEITLDFPVDEIEYVVVRGVGQFDSINMYGLQWNGDWRFQNYDVGGWYYDPQREVLYMKIQHRNTVERIRVFE